MFIEFKYFEKNMKEDLKNSLDIESRYIKNNIEGELILRQQAIKLAASFISNEREDKKIHHFLKEIMKNNSSFQSVYFLTPDNHMINGSDWVLPKNFDFRTRPWYKKALEKDDLILTEAYINASKEKWIITIAQPVYNSKHEFLGVIAGDSSIENITEFVKAQKISKNGYSIFIDGKGSILNHPKLKYDINSKPLNIKDFSESIYKSISKGAQDINLITLDGMKGYVLYEKIEGTEWKIVSFAPINDFVDYNRKMIRIFLTIILSVGVTLAILYILQKKYIIEPIIKLSRDVQKISNEKNITYRLTIDENDPFIDIRKSANIALERIQVYFEGMIESQEEFIAANEELSAAFQQLEAIEGELKEQNQELINSKKALEISEKRNRAIVNVLPDIIFIYSKDGVFLDYQTNDETKLLMKKEDFIGKKITEVMPEEIGNKGIESIEKAIATGEIQSFEYSLNFPKGVHFFETRIIKSTKEEALAIVRNITEQKKSLLRIEYLSYHDQLTGLYNRRFFEEELKKLDTEENLPFTIVMIDVNGLKLVNDVFGHLVGDELLKKVSDILKRECRLDDVAARIGGDEFIILLPQTTSEETEKIVRRIYKSIKNEKMENIIISVSIGWETKTSKEQLIDDIFIKAEDYMYKRKIVESQSMRNKTIQVIVNTLNEKNEREKIHSENVGVFSRKIAEAMKLDYDTIKEIEVAGLLHDIGKIIVREEVLNKPEKLTEAEYEEIKKHTEIGYQILKSVDAYFSLAEYVLYHHERWDGYGYPRGLKGKQIPLVSRIISAADAYEAMISDRPYRKGLKKEAAILELQRNSGTQFDPEIVDVFVKLL